MMTVLLLVMLIPIGKVMVPGRREWAEDIREALKAARLAHDVAARAQGLKPTHWSRQLQALEFGDRADQVSLNRLAVLPDAFWRALLTARARRVGLHIADEDHAARILGLMACAFTEAARRANLPLSLDRAARKEQIA